MNFDYNEDQMMLKESIQRWAQDNYSFDQRRASSNNEEGFSRDHYATFAELGWLSVPFAEEYGGYGGSIIDLAAIMEEFGRALVVEPVMANLVLFGGLLQASSNEDRKAELIPQIIDGSLLGGAALFEPQSRFDLSNVATTAVEQGDEYVLSGSKSVVVGGAAANKLVVSARTGGEQMDEAGISLFLVDADAKGVSKAAYALMDGHHAADFEFDETPAILISEKDQGYAIIQSVIDKAHIALSAEAIGLMDVLNRSTVDYTKQRKQFGVAIASFQALQHRMVDCFMSYEQAKSLLAGTLVELTAERTSAERAQSMLTALRTLIAKNGKHIGDEAIQLHGGMGITDELHIGHYVKRLMMINLLFGDAGFYQDQFNRVTYAAA